MEGSWSALSLRPALVTALLCGIQLSGVAARYYQHGPPLPHVHDEFSYLMAGETFASGRAAYPEHPMWVHFESPHIIQTPSRASFYPPGQSIVLAAGYLVGHPWFGVILSTLLMIATVYWAARQWLAPFWSLPVGVLGLLMVLGTYWTNSYWGGALNAFAGALVAGAAGALRRRASRLHLVLLASGIALCGITRPFGGSILSAATLGWLFIVIRSRGGGALKDYLRAAVPAAVLLAGAACLGLYYNYRVTGDPLRLPYTEGADQYVARRKFVFQDDPPLPAYRHKVLRDVYVGLKREGFSPFWRLLSNSINTSDVLHGKALLPVFILALFLLLSGRGGRLTPPIALALLGIGAMLCIPWVHTHYYAPFAAVALIATMAGLRAARCYGRGAGRRGWVIVAAAAALVLVRGGAQLQAQIDAKPTDPAVWVHQRAAIERRLASAEPRDIVIVRYAPNHDVSEEWVYNHADIDGAAVIWAREMDAGQNQRLLDYFKERTAWLLEADVSPPRLTAYPRRAR